MRNACIWFDIKKGLVPKRKRSKHSTTSNTMHIGGDKFRWPVSASSTSVIHENLHHNSEAVSSVTKRRDQPLENLAEEYLSATAPPNFLPKLTTLLIHEVVDQISHERTQNQNPEASAVMSKSESELALEKLVEELSTHATSLVPKKPTSSSIIADDSEEISVENPRPYNKHAQASRLDVYSILRAKLDMACAAAAFRFGEGSAGNECEDQQQAEQDSELGSQSPESDNDGMQKKRKVQIRKKTCGSTSSIVDSETNEGELDEATRQRRLELNRKSARSYRRRKQGQINELQTEIDQVMEVHASMASEFADVQKKHEDVVIENKKLKAEIETLKARVNITIEKVEQLMQLDPVLILNSRKNDIDNRVNDVSMEYSSSDNFICQQPGLDPPPPAAPSLHRLANIYFLDNNITAKRLQIDDVTTRTISTSNKR